MPADAVAAADGGLAGESVAVAIVAVHQDLDSDEPHFTIRMPDGGERQTEAHRLARLPRGSTARNGEAEEPDADADAIAEDAMDTDAAADDAIADVEGGARPGKADVEGGADLGKPEAAAGGRPVLQPKIGHQVTAEVLPKVRPPSEEAAVKPTVKPSGGSPSRKRSRVAEESENEMRAAPDGPASGAAFAAGAHLEGPASGAAAGAPAVEKGSAERAPKVAKIDSKVISKATRAIL